MIHPFLLVVFFFEGPLPDYASAALRIARAHGNEVALLTNASAPEFEAVYRPWGPEEPWERRNTARYFALLRFMRERDLERVFYLDSDVALLSRLRADEVAGCDAALSLQVPQNRARPYYWTVWAGTAVLSRRALEAYTAFVLRLYSEPFVGVLEEKRDRAPFVCDMTSWFLFVVKASEAFARQVDQESLRARLPPAPALAVCDITQLGFDHQLGSGGRSVHAQGVHKDVIFRFDPDRSPRGRARVRFEPRGPWGA